MVSDFQSKHWALIDLKYEYLDDGFKLIAYTDVPSHLYCRMTTVPPQEHRKPILKRGVLWRDDIRFCFVAYEDNEQEEAGDTLTHTFLKATWPICETRWFYFLGTIAGQPVPSDSAIFEFRFPPPPPTPPPPLVRTFYAELDNRTLYKEALTWAPAHDAPTGTVMANYDSPNYALFAGSYLAGGWHNIWRSVLRFNTLGLPEHLVASSAILSLWVFYSSGTTGKKIYVTKGIQQSPVVPADYGAQLGVTEPYAELKPVPWGGYVDFPLNAAGLASINPAGDTKFCVRGEVDLLDENPSAVYNQYAWYHSAQKGDPYKPRLTITYVPASPELCH